MTIDGAHILIYSANPDADRAFCRDVLNWKHVDVGHGWLIFRLPPAEAAWHPVDGAGSASGGGMVAAHLYLMCDDLSATIRDLAAHNVACTPVSTERWGIRTTIRLPSGSELGLYQPTHARATDLP